MLDSYFQEPAWRCDICDDALLSKAGNFNYMTSHGSCKQRTFSLRLKDTTCVICSEVYKVLSDLKRQMAVCKNLLQEQNQVTSRVIIPFVWHLCFKVCKTAASFKSFKTELKRKCLSRWCWRIKRWQSFVKIEQS